MSTADNVHFQPLEDDFQDIISKAARGRQQPVARLAEQMAEPPTSLEAWFDGSKQPNYAQAVSLASLLHLDPAALFDSLKRAWHPQTVLPPGVESYIQHAEPESNGYLLTANDRSAVALVDPAGDANELKKRVDAARLPLAYLFITHRHDDHADAAAWLLEAFPDVEILMHETEAVTRPELPRLSRKINDGDRFRFGNDEVEVIVTPGHTDGSTCFLFSDYIFVGDTLFAGSVGRNFGPTATYTEQLTNIRTHILQLSEHIIVLPGHGPPTTIGQEQQHNPFLK